MNILVINGPNLNMLGVREPAIYGTGTYAQLCELIRKTAADLGVSVDIFQSNHEGALIDRIQEAYGRADGIVINPAGYTHTSVALADALAAVAIPAVEVHISDVASREAFRQVSYVRDKCIATISGHGFAGYAEALGLLANRAAGAEASR
ncbi:MAG: type II 3-dehydroquinate dehydratase [Eggerthellaceae bacterium]|nr:type II 3-dehydroquinate dehydratase [Eggerthellaceae bacterium]